LREKNSLNWKKTKLQFIESDECEVSECRYYVNGLSNKKSLRVIFLRTKVQSDQLNLLEDEYRYFSFVSNIEAGEKLPIMKYEQSSKKVRKQLGYTDVAATIENLIKFYRKRGDTENFIREQKYGLDMKHYPCQKLSANKVFGLIGAFAYNLMRFSSFAISERGCFSKKIRETIINHGCQVVRHARTIKFKFNTEVKRRLEKIYERLTNLLSDKTLYQKS